MEAVPNIDSCPGEIRKIAMEGWCSRGKKEPEVPGHLEQLLCFYRSVGAY